MHRTVPFAAAIGLALLAPGAALACSACGCTLSSDWASQGIAATGGWHFDLRYDFFEQDELRSGTSKVSRSSFTYPADVEVQQYTINHNVAAALDYSPNRDFGINVTLPWYDRPHATIAEGDTQVSTSHDSGIGDLRVVGRYSGFAEQRSTGVLFGIKLPTGHFTDRFETGPQAGEIVDRGLQLGTGTVDAIIGAYHFGAFTPDWGYFGQVTLQQPLDSREGFKPGTGLNFNLGVRYMGNPTFEPQLQINARVEKREQGVNADVENSGATLVYLSPGVTWHPTRRLALFAFVQAPLYQRVNGLQLEAAEFASVGLHYHF
ncbi:MAG TPA: hypothetical protein VFB32_02775 [Rudaea sp.]|nr:hypothetical protein [Rudaea sp.]